MSLDRVGSGRNPPDDFSASGEISAYGEPVKCEIDRGSGDLRADSLTDAERERTRADRPGI